MDGRKTNPLNMASKVLEGATNLTKKQIAYEIEKLQAINTNIIPDANKKLFEINGTVKRISYGYEFQRSAGQYQTAYTTPKGRQAYITSITINGRYYGGAAAVSGFIVVYTGSSTDTFSNNNTAIHYSSVELSGTTTAKERYIEPISSTFPMPIIIKAGECIRIGLNTNDIAVSICINGYEVDSD